MTEPHRNVVARVFTNPHFQLWLNIASLVVALALTAVAPVLGLLESVTYVSWLSQIALIYGALSGVSAALVFKDAKEGFVLNRADWVQLHRLVRGDADGPGREPWEVLADGDVPNLPPE